MMNLKNSISVFLTFFICTLIFYTPALSQGVPYPPPDPQWTPVPLGNHRAVVWVEKDVPAVIVELPWRRRDNHWKNGAIYVYDAQKNKRIENVLRRNLTQMKGEVIFEPVSGAGTYYIYYMPYTLEGSSSYPTAVYTKFQNTADKDWTDKWRQKHNIPTAQFKKFDAINNFNKRGIMEIPASPSEVAELIKENARKPYLIFTEDRANLIIMKQKLPLKWVKEGPSNRFFSTVKQEENFAFQIGLFAHKQSLENVKLSFTDLTDHSGNVISKKYFSSLNTEGISYKGKHFQKDVDVKKNSVQPFWVLLNMPHVESGKYSGTVTIHIKNQPSRSVEIVLNVLNKVAIDRGVNKPWKQTRLTWLNSRLYQENTVIPPYTPLHVQNKTISLLGREVILDSLGFPKQIHSFFEPTMTDIDESPKDILSGPIHFVIKDKTGDVIPLKNKDFTFISIKEGTVNWSATNTSENISMYVNGSIEFDGFMNYTVKIVAEEDQKVSDLAMILPMDPEASKYMMGLDRKGGLRPEYYSWKWNVKDKNQDGAWIGAVNAGLRFSLRDQNYERPLNTNFYRLKPLVEPISWSNSGKGGIIIKEKGKIRAYSGERTLTAGDTLYYNFTLLITPFHTLQTNMHWKRRYLHDYRPIDSVLTTGATVINIHHANYINPYINYPFIAWKEMEQYIDSAHAAGLKVKIYNTVRELSNRAYETIPMISLGNEIYTDGEGGGPAWLQEHLNGTYIAGWFVPKLRDAAIVTNGMSRWLNYYVEGVDWLVQNVGIDGLYLDDVAFSRITMKRIKRALTQGDHPGIIDFHSANQWGPNDGFSNSANLYMPLLPYINRLWFGEYFEYENGPAYWMTEVSGIPFGLMGEMLQDGGNPWRGMLYGMTTRIYGNYDPGPIWEAWDKFGMAGSQMIGYWVNDIPVTTNNKDVLATVYKKENKAMISIASWASEDTYIKLNINWEDLGINPAKAKIIAPAIEGLQSKTVFSPGDKIPVEENKGWLLIIK